MIDIRFPDGSVRSFEKGVTGYQIAESISPRLAADVLAVAVKADGDTSSSKGNVIGLDTPIEENSSVRLLKWDDEEGKHVFWHSSAHLMAQALEALYPGVKFGIGPALETGFYYDVDLGGKVLSDSDLPAIEKKMLEMARSKEAFKCTHVAKADALKYFTEKGDEYKVELITELEDGKITFYQNGEFTDLCRGPHLRDTSMIKAVKLTAIAGAYWRGDEKRQQLTRIYGVTFPKKSLLDEYITMMEEAKKRDHRKLGKEMELFTFSSRVGMGLPLWLPRGTVMRLQLENFLRRKLDEYGYLPVVTPHIGSKQLYVTSGHYAKYGKDSFQPIHTPQEGEEYMLKPMNCPHHCEVFARKPRSYKDLPLRIAEFGTVFRYEKSGELHGLTRVRTFTQDDAHIFVRPEQVKQEFENIIDIILKVFRIFGFENYEAQISLHDPKDTEKYIGSEEIWAESENAIREACREKGLETHEEVGEAAFYGPKLDFMVKDAIGRRWQLGTIQVDYNLPQRFKLEYTAEDNSKQTPVMIHRAPFGSLERFTAVLIEHTAGHFPLWLIPDQVAILPISEKYNDYAREVKTFFDKAGVRALIDDRNEKIGRKIRDNELKRVPYMVVVGEKEAAEGLVSMRKQGGGEQATMTKEEFAKRICDEVAEQLKLAED